MKQQLFFCFKRGTERENAGQIREFNVYIDCDQLIMKQARAPRIQSSEYYCENNKS